MVGVRERLRETFGSLPELYDSARPPYPAELFIDLRSLTEGNRLLEIGCGTGQATRALVAHGFDVTCLELSAELAGVARRNVPEATIVVVDAERWRGPEFDVVAAFTAFHWLAPETRFATAARFGPLLAVVHTHHVRNDDPFWVESQADYDAVTPSPDNRPPPLSAELPELEVDSQLYDVVERRRYPVEVEYAPDDFIALLGTYSGNIVLPETQRDELFTRLHARVAAQGCVRKPFVYELTIARRR
jgi:SAM-dependent methyltransferase